MKKLIAIGLFLISPILYSQEKSFILTSTNEMKIKEELLKIIPEMKL